jgi:hypothetical protein
VIVLADRQPTSVRLSDAERAALDRVAAREERSRADTLRLLIRDADLRTVLAASARVREAEHTTGERD